MLTHELLRRPGPQDRLLLLVHGYGESAAMMTERLDELDPEGRFVALVPDAPFEHKGALIWHRAMSGEPGTPAEQFLHSLDLLDRLVGTVCAAEDLDPATAVFGGFSQGAGLAVALTCLAGERPPPAGCLAFCGFLPPVPGLPVRRAPLAGVPLLLLASTRDEFVPIEASRHSAAALVHLGLTVTYRELEAGHTITDEAVRLAAGWLDGREHGGDVPVEGPGGMWDLIRGLWEIEEASDE